MYVCTVLILMILQSSMH